MNAFIKAGRFGKSDFVLDVGTGTGKVAKAVAPLVKTVIGIDTSSKMLEIARQNANAENIIFEKHDVRNLLFPNRLFSKVTARMVFHHILKQRERAIKECYRVLHRRGRIIFSEGVPPNKECRPLYDKIFALKEKRVSFLPEEIKALLTQGGFVDVKMKTYWMRRVSTRKWLENSGLPQGLVHKIVFMHFDADKSWRKAYNMTVTENDAIVDWKYVIAVGVKM